MSPFFEEENAEAKETELRERLKLKWLPFAEGFVVEHVDKYESFLSLSDEEQNTFIATLGETDFEFYITLLTSRAMYRDPVDRTPGSITEALVARYPDKYGASF